jgi:hypothetical protein
MQRTNGLTGLGLGAIRWAAPWAGVLFLSTALAYGFNTAITDCCPSDSGLGGGNGAAVYQGTIQDLPAAATLSLSVNRASALESGLRTAEPPDRTSDNRSAPIGDW